MSHCSKCNKKIGLVGSYKCPCCQKSFCGDCIEKVSYDSHVHELIQMADNIKFKPTYFISKMARCLCLDCAKVYEEKVSRMRRAMASYGNREVTIISINYRGNKYNRLTPFKRICSGYYKQKADAERELTILSIYLDCYYIGKFSFDKKINWEEGPNGGDHYYTVWRCSGVAMK